MVWESSSTAIVMLTVVTENGMEKSKQYWPTEVNTPVQHGDIIVKVLSKTSNPDWTTSKILLQKVNWIQMNFNLYRSVLTYSHNDLFFHF